MRVLDDILNQLKAIADHRRFTILNLLIHSDICVGALAHRLDLSQGAVSQHLQILRKAGLVKGEKRGYWTHYSVDQQALEGLGRKIQDLIHQPIFTEEECRRHSPDTQLCCRKEGEEDA